MAGCKGQAGARDGQSTAAHRVLRVAKDSRHEESPSWLRRLGLGGLTLHPNPTIEISPARLPLAGTSSLARLALGSRSQLARCGGGARGRRVREVRVSESKYFLMNI